MSLDVYLELDHAIYREPRRAIFIRRNGSTVEISREEWDKLCPGREPVTLETEEGIVDGGEIYHRNITHNLGPMAAAAGVYQACWRPDELGITHAADLVPILTEGLRVLRADPDHFREFNPPNKWGDYEGLVEFVDSYLSACRAYPEARVLVSR